MGGCSEECACRTRPQMPDHPDAIPERIAQVEELLIDRGKPPINRVPVSSEVAAVFDWPWYPFKESTDEEGRELERRKLARMLGKAAYTVPEQVDQKMSPYLAE